MTANDKFGFRNTDEFKDNQNFVLMKNNNYAPSARPERLTFQYRYTPEDFSVSAYNTLNVLDDDILLTSKVSSANVDTGQWSQKRYDLLTSVQNSSTSNSRSRQAINGRSSMAPQRSSGVSSPSAPMSTPTRGGGGY